MRWITLTLFYFLIFLNLVARKRLVAPIPWGGEEEAQEEASCSESQLLLHGCKMSRYAFCTHTHRSPGVWVLDYQPLWLFCRMLQDHDGVQPCSDSRAVCGLLYSPVSAHRRQSTSHRGSVFICVQCSSTAGVSSDGIQWPADINTDCIMHFFKSILGLLW